VGLGISTTLSSSSSPSSFEISLTDEVFKVEGIDGLEVRVLYREGGWKEVESSERSTIFDGYLVHWIVVVEYLLHLMMVAELQL
jgi:hypothetical protein